MSCFSLDGLLAVPLLREHMFSGAGSVAVKFHGNVRGKVRVNFLAHSLLEEYGHLIVGVCLSCRVVWWDAYHSPSSSHNARYLWPNRKSGKCVEGSRFKKKYVRFVEKKPQNYHLIQGKTSQCHLHKQTSQELSKAPGGRREFWSTLRGGRICTCMAGLSVSSQTLCVSA